MARHYFSDTAVTTQLATGVSSSALTVAVASTSGFPASFPYYLVIDQSNASMEIVRVTSAAALTLTVDRGASSTSAVSHTAGAQVIHVAAAEFYNTLSAHEATNVGVHGVSELVGRTDVQTLTNKTISGAANTITGIAKASVAGSPTGAFVGDTDTQTLTGKTISGASNTITNIPKASVVGAPTGAVVGDTDTQTLTGKTMSGASNTFTNIPSTAIPAVVGAAPQITINNTAGSYSFANPGAHKFIHLQMMGGGGGGAGAAQGSNLTRGGGGGGAGAFTEVWIPAGTLTFPVSYVVGARGTGGVGAANGNAGGASNFGTITAPGGSGGPIGPTTPDNATGTFTQGVGSGASGGSVGAVPVGTGYSVGGGRGAGPIYAVTYNGTSFFCDPAGGDGGSSYYGMGGRGASASGSTLDATAAGAGGAGAGITADGNATGGLAGAGQLIISVYT